MFQSNQSTTKINIDKNQIPTKTLQNGFSLPALGLGTWLIGGAFEKDLSCDFEDAVFKVRTAINSGLTHIDTAEAYANGYTEEIIGEAISSYPRAILQIGSKVLHTNLKYDDVLLAADRSLKRLKTSYLDLYLIHGPNPEIPIKETISAMNKLVDDGIVINIGVSNFSVEKLKEAQDLSRYPIVLNQIHYNVKVREAESSGLLEYCQNNDIFLVAWRPLEKGAINSVSNSLLEELSEKYEKTHSQIVLNWLISQRNVVTIFKASSKEHFEENLGSVGWAISDDDIERIRNEFPDQLMKSPSRTVGI